MIKPKVIAIVGPTASGKSALGIFLAKKIDGEIISADSRQVYKGLDIGTGKVTKKEMAGIPHHLLDVAHPKKQFSADDFVKNANKALEAISKKAHIPIIVGGTGFYIDALLGRIILPEVPPNPNLRKRLQKKNAEKLFAMLKKKDPERAQTIDKYNPVRLIRAIEIAAWRGRKNPEGGSTARSARGLNKFSAENLRTPEGLLSGASYGVLWLGITFPIETLEKKINKRLVARIEQGMIKEAQRLHTQGLSFKRMEELGLEYRSLARYLQKEISKEEMIAELQSAIRNYAKRQMRWFKRNKNIRWVKNKSEALGLTKAFLKR